MQVQTSRRIVAMLLTFLTACALCSTLTIAAHADSKTLSDGMYDIDVELSGGSGKASVTSPARIVVKFGETTATIEWSSPYYDLMIVDGEKYLPTNKEGNSTFEIPVSAFDTELPIQAETTAMSEPHLIDYTLRFDSSTATLASAVDEDGSMLNIIIPVVIVLVIAFGVSAAIRARRRS